MKRCILHIALFVAAAVVLTACGSGKKAGVWTDGAFSLSYPSETYEVTEEDKDGDLSCFTISGKETPSNNIEFKVYRYEPDFVKTIRIDQIAGELKNYGFKYLGTVTVYSHLQACGIVNDHAEECPCYQAINRTHPTVRKRRFLEK